MNRHINGKTKKVISVNTAAEKENPVAVKAAGEKSRNRALARRLRKTGQIASLSADVSSVIEDFTTLSDQISSTLGKGEKALGKVISEIQEAVFLSETAAESSEYLCVTAANVHSAIEFIDGAYMENTGILAEIIDSVNCAAQTQNSIKKRIDELIKSGEKGEKLVETVNNIAEQIDVTGLNASLEAGRLASGNAVLSVLAEQIQKTSASFAKIADDFKERILAVKTLSNEAAEKVTGIGDRIRTVSVMTKGIINAYNELRMDITELGQWAELITAQTVGMFSGRDDYPPGYSAIEESAKEALSHVGGIAAAFRNSEAAFSAASKLSEVLSEAAAGITSEQNLPDRLDVIITAAEDFAEIAGETEAGFENSISLLEETSSGMEELERKTELTAEQLDEIAGTAADILDTSGGNNEKLEKIRDAVVESRKVLDSIVKEIESILSENKAFDLGMISFGLRVQHAARCIHSLGAVSAKLDSITLSGGIEIARTEQNEAGFAKIPGRLENSTAEIAKTIEAIGEYADSLEESSAEIVSCGIDADWPGISEMIKELAQETGEVVDITIPAALESTGAVVSSIQKQIKEIDRIRDRIKEVAVSSESAANLVRNAGELTMSRKSVLERAYDVCEKLQACAEELYPEEE